MSAESVRSAHSIALADAPETAPSTERIEWLIDNADTYRAIVAMIRGARRTIWICQLALDADCVAPEIPTADGRTTSSVLILDELVTAAARGVDVRVLLNASLLLDTTAPLRAHLLASGVDTRRLRVRGMRRFPQLLHAKMVIVDDQHGALVGSPFANGYWDDSRHLPADARRPRRELGGRPIHDVSTLLAGPCVLDLATSFAELWNDANDRAPNDREPLAAPQPRRRRAATRTTTRVVRTAPGEGPMEILPALLSGIARARSLIYVEHQYLSARLVVDALSRALEQHAALEIVIVLNQNPDVTAYRGWQNVRLLDAGLLSHPRVGVFSLWSSSLKARSGRRQLTQLFVHSKVVTVDDRWASVGSANLDGVSLHSYGHDFSSALGRCVFRDVRNFDVNVIMEGTPGDETAGQVRALRTGLWHEHLGVAPPMRRPADGWIPLWRSAARNNVAALREPADRRFLEGPFILPYSTRSTPRAQLADVGVLFAPEAVELCFEPSWLEVHFSPNWVRNMFG